MYQHVTDAERRADLIQLAAIQPKSLQRLACVAACERAYPLVNRLGSYKSRLVSRYAIDELWDHVLFEYRETGFLSMIDGLPEVSAWDPNTPAYYAMSGISVVAHTHKFLESSREENLEYVAGTLFDLATEYDTTPGARASSLVGMREKEIASQRGVYRLASAWSNLDSKASRLLKNEILREAMTYLEPINLFCSLHGWFEPLAKW